MSNKGGSRPMGVTIIAALSVIGGAFGALAGLSALGLVGVLGGAFGVYVLPLLVVSIASIIIGVAFYQLTPWAWNAMVIVTVVNAIIGLMSFSVLSVVIDAVIAYYLFTKVVKTAFKVTVGPTF